VIRTGPCALHLTALDGETWLTGTYSDPTNTMPLQVTVGTPTVIAQGFRRSTSLLPDFRS
jgi:hypothetical protein